MIDDKTGVAMFATTILDHRSDQQVGLAWAPAAGGLLPLLVTAQPGAGRMIVTTNSAVQGAADQALASVRDGAGSFVPGFDAAWFASHDIQLSQPWGTVPADLGPDDWMALGAAVAAAVVSLLSGHLVRPEVAICGVLGPSGELLPVAGFADKAIAAQKDGAQRMVAPVGNETSLGQVPDRVRTRLEVVFAVTIGDILKAALAKHAVKGYALADSPVGSAAAAAYGPGRAQAVVISSELDWESTHVRSNMRGGFAYDLMLRVHYGDGSTADLPAHLGPLLGSDASAVVGQIVPVRYDPQDRTQVEIDVDAVRDRAAQASRAEDEARIRAAEQRLGGGA